MRDRPEAEATDNALLLVVGYTDSTGNQEYNQVLSERRAGRVVNYLQQECGWAPYRMLTPTGMAEADPAADNSTAAGRAPEPPRLGEHLGQQGAGRPIGPTSCQGCIRPLPEPEMPTQ